MLGNVPFCNTCGHDEHMDPINGDYCWAVTPGPDGGICGCEHYDETWMDESDEREPEEAELA